MQRPELSHSEARNFWGVSQVGPGSQSLGSPLTSFPSHKLGAEWEAGLLGHETANIWDASACKMRALATKISCRAQFTYSLLFPSSFPFILTRVLWLLATEIKSSLSKKERGSQNQRPGETGSQIMNQRGILIHGKSGHHFAHVSNFREMNASDRPSSSLLPIT